jgi:hypothetical protein
MVMSVSTYTEFAEQQNLTMQAGSTPAPFILRLALFISVVLLGTVSANNVYPSQIGLFLSPGKTAEICVINISTFIQQKQTFCWKINE